MKSLVPLLPGHMFVLAEQIKMRFVLVEKSYRSTGAESLINLSSQVRLQLQGMDVLKTRSVSRFEIPASNVKLFSAQIHVNQCLFTNACLILNL